MLRSLTRAPRAFRRFQGLWYVLNVRPVGALLLFDVTVVAWSCLSVAGTTLAASLGLPEGEAVGAFSAVGAVAGVTGALLGGVLVRYTGYGALPLAATGFMAAAAWMSLSPRAVRP